MRNYFHSVALLVVLACARDSADTGGMPETTATRPTNADSLATVQVARAALVATPGHADLAGDSVTVFRLDSAGTVLRFGRPADCGAYTNCYRPSAVVLVRPGGKAEVIAGFAALRLVGPDSGA